MSSPQAKSTAETISDLKSLLIDYTKQETLVPLKGLTRYLVRGVLGSLLVGMGVFFLGLAALRALQVETGTTFTGTWSFAPYFFVLIGLAMVIGLSLFAMDRKRKRT